MKDELGGQIMKEFVGLRSKMYWYLKENNDENIKAKGTKNCVIKIELKFQDYKTCLRVSQIKNIKNYSAKNKLIQIILKKMKKKFIKTRQILKTQQRLKSEKHNVFTEANNKIA